ncbi:MAG TPA: BTAD domain-containing putative transcriptional regulator [Thermomicrobiales bacterium]|nr:BTAD domain-containing putative transcriptional regulator [Thermomicrobiales bacterium]
MDHINVQLLGRFAIRRNGHSVPHTDGLKLQELFSYLVLNRARSHNRETLAGVLWGGGRSDQARKYLRQTLWQLQSSLAGEAPGEQHELLVVDSGWVHLNLQADISVDVMQLEQAFDLVRDVPGQAFTAEIAGAIMAAAGLYQGDLLEGWYQDWCLIERERLQVIYLILLDKLMGYCEQQQEFERGIAYGHQILLIDRAREQTHRRLMRLHALAGDRTSAIRQFERCQAMLAEDLDIDPSQRTVDLFARIRADRFPVAGTAASGEDQQLSLVDVSTHLKQIRATLAGIDQQLQHDIQVVDQTMLDRADPAALDA